MIQSRSEKNLRFLKQSAPPPRYIIERLKKATRKEATAIAALDIASKDTQLRELMQAHQTLVFNLCLRLTKDYFTAEDLAQETFLAAHQNLERFDGANPAGWLTTIATRKCLDHLRSAAVRKSQFTEDDALLRFPSPVAQQPEARFFDSHFEQALQRACEALREPYKSVALGYYREEKSLAAIAQETGTPIDTVRTRCYRAKHMLRQILEREMRYDMSIK